MHCNNVAASATGNYADDFEEDFSGDDDSIDEEVLSESEEDESVDDDSEVIVKSK